MRITIGGEMFEVDEVVAATRTFPYWVFWQEQEDGQTETRFIHMDKAPYVTMVGNKEDEEGKGKPNLKVVPFKTKGGD